MTLRVLEAGDLIPPGAFCVVALDRVAEGSCELRCDGAIVWCGLADNIPDDIEWDEAAINPSDFARMMRMVP